MECRHLGLLLLPANFLVSFIHSGKKSIGNVKICGAVCFGRIGFSCSSSVFCFRHLKAVFSRESVVFYYGIITFGVGKQFWGWVFKIRILAFRCGSLTNWCLDYLLPLDFKIKVVTNFAGRN